MTRRTAIVIPKVDVSADEVLVTQWLKAEGDRITVGEPVVDLETSKASFEVEAEKDGILLKRTSLLREPGHERQKILTCRRIFGNRARILQAVELKCTGKQ